MDMKLCKPKKDSYIIIESLHTSDTFRLSEITQIYRQVIGFCGFKSFLFDGKPLSGPPSQWQYVKHFLSSKRRITTAPTGKDGLYYVYRGVKNSLKPLNSRSGPGLLTSEYKLGTPKTPFTWGVDPVPHVHLYGSPDIHFVMPGNSPPPTAFAIYDPATDSIEEVRDPKERKRLISQIVHSANK